MDKLDAFVEVARDYCDTIERAEQLGLEIFLDAIEPKIARLYAAGAELGNPFAFGGDDDYDAPRVRDRSVYTRLSELLGDAVEFEGPLEISLTVALGDTYFDIRSGLAALDEGHREEAGYELAFGFRYHWGYHAWEALAAIHSHRTGYPGD